MEFEYFSTLIFVVSSLLIIFKLLQKSGSDNTASLLLNRIPGPTKLPVIGNLHLLAGKSPPHRVFRDLAAKYGPLMRLQLGSLPCVFVSSVEVAKQVLITHDLIFANRPPLFALKKVTYDNADIGTAPYGERWRQLRKICTLELLSGRRIKSFHPIREEVISDLAKWIASDEGSPVNLSQRVYQSLFDILAMAAIGRGSEEKQAIITAVNDILEMAGGGICIVDFYPSIRLLPVITGMNSRMQRIFRQTDRILQRIIDDRRAAPEAVERSDYMVDLLLKCQEDKDGVRLTDDNVKAVIMDMFIAGAETTAAAVDWTMSELMRNPRALKAAQDEVRQVFDGKGYVDEEKFKELKYLKSVIKESLRMHPPGPFLMPRMNSEKCEINGYEIPVKTRVVINAWALGRDPKYWNEPDVFMPKRFEDSSIDFKGGNLEYMPFGVGRRICPGMPLGLVNTEFFLAMLLYHFDWKMPNGMKNEELDMSEGLITSLKRTQDLVLVPTPKRSLVH